MFLAQVAGVDPDDLAVLVGAIPSTGEPHAVLMGDVGGKHYLLDNRTLYVTDIAVEADFVPQYSVDQRVLWIYVASIE